MKSTLLIASIFLLMACGASYTVDYDKKTKFEALNSYQLWPDIDSGLSELDDKRIVQAIDSSLQSRGITKADYNQFFVNFYASEEVAASRNTIGVGLGSGGGNVGIGVNAGIPIGGPIIRQQLTIDIIDASENFNLIWQVVIDGEIKERASSKQWEAYYFKVINKALQKFPPKE